MTSEFDPVVFSAEWNHCHGAFLQVRASDLQWNLKEQKWLRYQWTRVGAVPILWAEASSCGIDAGISGSSFWVSLHGEIPSGEEGVFLSALKNLARGVGKSRLVMAGEEFHFLPGIPVSDPPGQRLAKVFSEAGASLAACSDYVGELHSLAVVAYAKKAEANARNRGWALCRVESQEQKSGFGDFLKREFKGRWEREWKFWNQQPDTGRAFWNVLLGEAGSVLGFSRLAVRGLVCPQESGWNPGSLRLPLSDAGDWQDTDSCLGPIGVAATERGRGVGGVLLGLSLLELQKAGGSRVCIDWTNAHEFYAPLNFCEARKFQSAALAIEG
jgi:hypothetical protein